MFVNTAVLYNWHNCQVRARNKLGVLLASLGRVIKGTCFWRHSQGHVTHEHVGATVRLIKWLPLISTMHMKGLCLLHDRFSATSLRDLPRYTRTDAGRKTMYHSYSSLSILSTVSCVYYYMSEHKHSCSLKQKNMSINTPHRCSLLWIARCMFSLAQYFPV